MICIEQIIVSQCLSIINTSEVIIFVDQIDFDQQGGIFYMSAIYKSCKKKFTVVPCRSKKLIRNKHDRISKKLYSSHLKGAKS